MAAANRNGSVSSADTAGDAPVGAENQVLSRFGRVLAPTSFAVSPRAARAPPVTQATTAARLAAAATDGRCLKSPRAAAFTAPPGSPLRSFLPTVMTVFGMRGDLADRAGETAEPAGGLA